MSPAPPPVASPACSSSGRAPCTSSSTESWPSSFQLTSSYRWSTGRCSPPTKSSKRVFAVCMSVLLRSTRKKGDKKQMMMTLGEEELRQTEQNSVLVHARRTILLQPECNACTCRCTVCTVVQYLAGSTD